MRYAVELRRKIWAEDESHVPIKWPWSSRRRIYELDEVFGVHPLTDDRPSVVTRHIEERISWAAKENVHVVLYGPSKQGKSWLVSKYFRNSIRIGCSTDATALGILQSLSRYSSDDPVTEETIEKHAAVNLHLVHAGITHTDKFAPATERDVVDAIERIANGTHMTGHFIIDNFHFLPAEEKRRFSPILREMNERRLRFVIVGIWQEDSQFESIIGDLTGRLRQFSVNTWNDEELRQIAHKGFAALNISVTDDLITDMIRLSARNVGIFQTLLHYYCVECGVLRTIDFATPILKSEKGKLRKAVSNCYHESMAQSFYELSSVARLSEAHRRVMRSVASLLRKDDGAEGSQSLTMNGVAIDDVYEECAVQEYPLERVDIQASLRSLNMEQETILPSPAFYVDFARGYVSFLDQAILAAREMATYLGEEYLRKL